jgi:hypothetical protein
MNDGKWAIVEVGSAFGDVRMRATELISIVFTERFATPVLCHSRGEKSISR